MVLSREEKEKLVLDLYYNKGYTYRQIAKDLRMSPNQLRDIIRRQEEKNNAIADKKKELSLSSKAYKLFSKGKSSVQVATRLDIPEVQVTEFRLEYLRLIGLDELVSLFARTKGKLSSLLNLFDELVVKRGMSIEQIVLAIEISIHKLPYVENLYEQAKKEVDRLIEKRDYLLFDRNSLKKELAQLREEIEKQRRILATPGYSNEYYDKDGNKSLTGTLSYYNFDRRVLSFMLPESPPPPELAE